VFGTARSFWQITGRIARRIRVILPSEIDITGCRLSVDLNPVSAGPPPKSMFS
jgi:hypothetical protein